MAATDSFHRQPSTAKSTVFLQRFDRVVRARRVVAAGAAENRREYDLISSHQQYEEVLHVLSVLHHPSDQ